RRGRAGRRPRGRLLQPGEGAGASERRQGHGDPSWGRSSTSSHALTPNTLTTVCFTGGSTEHALISLSDCPHLGERRAPRRLCGLLAHDMFSIDTGEGPLIVRGGPICISQACTPAIEITVLDTVADPVRRSSAPSSETGAAVVAAAESAVVAAARVAVGAAAPVAGVAVRSAFDAVVRAAAAAAARVAVGAVAPLAAVAGQSASGVVAAARIGAGVRLSKGRTWLGAAADL